MNKKNRKSLKYFVLLIFIAGFMTFCNQGVEIPVPELKQKTYTIGPGASVLEFNNVILDIPAGAVTEETQLTFGYTDVCDIDRPVYFFRCPAISIYPVSLVFEKPVRITIRENLFWLKNQSAFNADPYKSAMYSVSKNSSAFRKVEGASVLIEGDELVVSGEILELGYYQLGMGKDEFYPDWSSVNVEIVNDSLDLFVTYTLESNAESSGSGYASYLPGYLQDSFYLYLTAEEGNRVFALSSCIGDTVGTYRKPFIGQDFVITTYWSNSGYKILAGNVLGKTAEVTITRFDRPEGRIEGSFSGSGFITYADFDSDALEIELSAQFSFAIK